MKKNILIILMLVPVLGFIASCKKSSFEDRYLNPEKTTNGTIDGLYTGLFRNRRIVPDYWNVFTFMTGQMGIYTQTVGVPTTNKMYEQAVAFAEQRWDDFYASPDGNWTAPISSYREMEKLYKDLSDVEKDGYLLLMETGKVFLLDQATQMVDFYGDIPFSKAGSLNTNGTVDLPSYDNGADVYDTALVNLKRISNWLATVQPQQFYLSKLAKQDIVYKGDLQKWRRYTNSLILRLAMRISYVDEPKAKSYIQEIMGDPTRYPVIDGNADNALVTTGSTDLLTILDGSQGAFVNGHNVAPGYLVDSLWKPSGDPRLRIVYALNKNGQYQGLPVSLPFAQQQAMISNQLVSTLDTVTFVKNQRVPGIIMAAAEVNFLKAEAAERWGFTGGTAKSFYENGIKQSIELYYSIHTNSSDPGTRETPITGAEIALLLTNAKVAYGTDNLNKIATQKWADFGLFQNTQAWAEMRRTGFPKLTFATDPGTTQVPSPAYRLLYPTKEVAMNAKNYAAVADKDKPFSKVFWMR
ncbi:SusD/RagB family nutrient-binding outer membrane lipoprotein [Chitinophaga agrisoli]|uniref:SusD/RagB family nutrient-binding outer membrane lipoprotein n=1 Tax=Chitinophaga agrisoli TaxID=2607653 RepID=A0A5B2VSM1_9BACT|nr:SusD/RagB family nutrient-binding outer membrane lipoprotein [Chitinophaga agrisoli]KAA2241844.1 SusD/RagB family nutrient-binding outer membrane lipoprotein [Chitinophaga agrisoli]